MKCVGRDSPGNKYELILDYIKFSKRVVLFHKFSVNKVQGSSREKVKHLMIYRFMGAYHYLHNSSMTNRGV